jgi:hypothetical protein
VASLRWEWSVSPLGEQPHDLGDLPLQQAVHRAATGRLVGEFAAGSPVKPPVDAQLTDSSTWQAARTVQPAWVAWPSKSSSPDLVAASTWAGPGHSAQRPFPSTSTSLTASSRSASPSRAASARAASSSRSRLACCTPGLDSASAWIAPSLATVRSRMLVERSTPTGRRPR